MKNLNFLIPMMVMSGLLLTSCSPSGGHSDDCGPGNPAPIISISTLNGQPVPITSDLPVQRTNGMNLSISIGLVIDRNTDWCRKFYSGTLTLSLLNLPSGITSNFDQNPIPPGTPSQSQSVMLLLSVPSSTPDGPISLVFGAQESPVFAQNYRLIISTIP